MLDILTNILFGLAGVVAGWFFAALSSLRAAERRALEERDEERAKMN